MATRVQGGTCGILSAIDGGWLDPLDASLPEERDLPHMTPADRRRIAKRDRQREKMIARRMPF